MFELVSTSNLIIRFSSSAEEGTVFIEGVDYYYDAQGRWVFTAAYHEKRGYCCDSDCLHCPYRGELIK